MERFKAVEKAMKTKAYSKEGLSAAAKLDPKEQAKLEASEFLSGMVDELEQQIEAMEAEGEAIQATMKKGKSQGAKADRMAEIEGYIEKHKWHQSKLELIRRSLENGGVEADQVTDLEESIRYYVTDGMTEDFVEDDEMYDELNLQEEEDAFGMVQENDRVSSQDTQSVQDEMVEDIKPALPPPVAPKPRPAAAEVVAPVGRRPSAQLKSPLPQLATLHTPLPAINSNGNATANMKPAAPPARPLGEGLKYASAAAAAAASDKNGLGIAPLPPPVGAGPASLGISPLPPAQARTSTTSSPSVTTVQPTAASTSHAEARHGQSAAPQPVVIGTMEPPSSTAAKATPAAPPQNSTQAPGKPEAVRSGSGRVASGKAPILPEAAEPPKGMFHACRNLSSPALLARELTFSSRPSQRLHTSYQARRGRTGGRVHLPPSGVSQ